MAEVHLTEELLDARALAAAMLYRMSLDLSEAFERKAGVRVSQTVKVFNFRTCPNYWNGFSTTPAPSGFCWSPWYRRAKISSDPTMPIGAPLPFGSSYLRTGRLRSLGVASFRVGPQSSAVTYPRLDCAAREGCAV